MCAVRRPMRKCVSDFWWIKAVSDKCCVVYVQCVEPFLVDRKWVGRERKCICLWRKMRVKDVKMVQVALSLVKFKTQLRYIGLRSLFFFLATQLN